MKNIYSLSIFILILILAVYFRLTGLNWDNNQHLHPDERFLTMVTLALEWPPTIAEYFQTDTSTLNPHNMKFDFFVYGTWPILVVKYISEQLKFADYNNLTLVGRGLSVLMDIFSLILVYAIGKKLSKRTLGGLISAFSYACMALPIQLSHYFTVDPYANITTLAVLFLLLIPLTPFVAFALGIAFGLTIAAKISSLILLPIICISCLYWCFQSKSIIKNLFSIFLFFSITYITVRFTFPYLFQNSSFFSIILNPKVLANWHQLKLFDNPDTGFPPSIQWITTTPIVFPLANIIFVCLGFPFSIFALISCGFLIIKSKHNIRAFFLSLFMVILFLFQGFQFAKATRYFYSLYPLLAVSVGYFSLYIIRTWSYGKIIIVCFLTTAFIWSISVTQIYRRPHTRIEASTWIYHNIAEGSTIATEHWDDPLPLRLPYDHKNYNGVQLPLYDRDTVEKWTKITETLKTTDYIILTSNRLYGSLTTVPDKYAFTNIYYHALFDGSLGFTRVATFVSRPTIPIPFISTCIKLPYFRYGTISNTDLFCPPRSGIQIIDDYTDEMWTVYDHPSVIIFKKK